MNYCMVVLVHSSGICLMILILLYICLCSTGCTSSRWFDVQRKRSRCTKEMDDIWLAEAIESYL